MRTCSSRYMNQRSAGQSALPDSAQSSSFSHSKKKYFPYTVHIQYRVGQNISNFQRFHTVIRQALFYPKVPKLANFRRSLAEIEWCANFLALRSDKNKQDREQFFAVRFVCPSSSKHNFTVPLIKVLFLNFTPILYIFFANMSKRHLKN